VVVVSNYPVLRAGLESLLRAGPEQVRIVDSVTRLDQGPPPDLAVIDLHAMPDCEDDLQALATTCPVVGLQPEATPELAERARDLGVTVLLPLSTSREQLILACRQLLNGSGTDQGLDGDHGLSARELQIVALIAAGRTNGEIAEQLYLSINSVKSYIRSAYGKLGISRRSHAVKWAMEQGLVER
jgi:DNA-binding NarL/FixJ family response regulator